MKKKNKELGVRRWEEKKKRKNKNQSANENKEKIGSRPERETKKKKT